MQQRIRSSYLGVWIKSSNIALFSLKIPGYLQFASRNIINEGCIKFCLPECVTYISTSMIMQPSK